MKLFSGVLVFIFLAWNPATISEEIVTPLKPVQVLAVEGPENNQPSGLTIFNNTLFTVSDKHDDTIFRVQLMDDRAVLVPHIQFKLSESVTEKVLDFEGITCDNEGNFYIVSESTFRILRVSSDGDRVSWVSPNLRSYGEKVGLFQTRGAYLEGITLVDENQFVVCAERQPRGIIEVNTDRIPSKAIAFKYDTTIVELPKDRNPDFTGLFWEDGILYTLQRNAYVLCKLVKGHQGFEEKDFWSYEAIVTREEFQYENMTFGRAEGLGMDKNYVYVILDNNGDARRSDPSDQRPLLLIMERP